jgi:DNA polymerase-3 subunit gamma/tau
MSNWTVDLRPTQLNDVYGADNVKKFFNNLSKEKKEYPNAVLLRGHFGSGKTTLAKILAARMTCLHPKENGDACNECENCKAILNDTYNRGNVLFIDGSQAGKDDVIDLVTDFTAGPPMGSPRKVAIIDESQELSTAATKSLLKILETPRKKIHFILTSMDGTDKIGTTSTKSLSAAIVSRCQTFIFKRAPTEDVMKYLYSTLKQQNLLDKVPKEFVLTGLQMIADNSGGSYRQALQTLEQCITLETYTEKEITDNLGIVNVVSFYQMMFEIMEGNTTDEVFNLMFTGNYDTVFNFSYKVISDAACYRAFSKIPGEIAQFTTQAKNLAAHPNFDVLLEGFQKIADKSGGYLKKADFVIGVCETIKHCKKQGVTEASIPPAARRVKRG